MICSAAAPEFCWTVRRSRWWRQCRRKYFLAYYGGYGGHDAATADGVTRYLYVLRRQLDAPTYLRRVLSLEMRRLFYREEPVQPGELEVGCRRRLEREFAAMLARRWERDPQLPALVELEKPGHAPFWQVKRQLIRELTSRLTALENGIWSELRRIPQERRLVIASPLFLQLGELKCAAVPLLAFALPGGRVQIWENTSSAGAGDFITLLHRFHALNAWHREPQQVQSYHLREPELVPEELGRDFDFSATLAVIRDETSAMLGRIRPDGTVDSADFPVNPSACAGCVFYGNCRDDQL